MDPFNEEKLREDIIKTWGPAGAHIEVFDMMRVCTECRGGCPDKEHPVARRMCQECYDNIVRLPFERVRAEADALREALEYTDSMGASTREGDTLGWWIFDNTSNEMTTRQILRKFLAELRRRAGTDAARGGK